MDADEHGFFTEGNKGSEESSLPFPPEKTFFRRSEPFFREELPGFRKERLPFRREWPLFRREMSGFHREAAFHVPDRRRSDGNCPCSSRKRPQF